MCVGEGGACACECIIVVLCVLQRKLGRDTVAAVFKVPNSVYKSMNSTGVIIIHVRRDEPACECCVQICIRMARNTVSAVI